MAAAIPPPLVHQTQVVRQEQPNDECVCVTVRCCDNSKTDSTMTIFGVHTLTADEISELIDAHHATVADKHAAMISGTAVIRGLSLQKVAHTRAGRSVTLPAELPEAEPRSKDQPE